MVPLETIATNSQEEARREAPALECVEQPISPEEQVEQALEEVETVKKEFDPVQADIKMTQDQGEYAERLSASPELIAEADEAIAGEFSAIKKEEAGLLAKLNEKLRKFSGILALSSIVSVSEGVSADVGAPDDQPTTTASTAIQAKSEDEHYRSLRERAALYRDMEKKVVEGKFESEQELVMFLRDVAEKYDGEVSVLYGVDGTGRMKFFQGQFALQQDSVGSASAAFVKKAKMLGVSELVEAHTHPKKMAVSKGYANGNVPPSLVDIHASAKNSWSDQFDNPTASESSAYGSVPTRQSVVTEKGVWEYAADYSNPYMQWQRKVALMVAMKDLDPEKFDISKQDAESYLRMLQVPDELVLKREERRLDDKGAKSLFLKYSGAAEEALRGGDIVKVGKDIEYEWTAEQLKVPAASPEAEGRATTDFIRFCEERGIKMKYTPFEKIGVAVTGNVE